jgi:hypothetical protein
MIRRARCTRSVLSGIAALCLAAGAARAQTAPTGAGLAPGAGATPAVRSTGVPQRDTLIRMNHPMTIAFHEHRLEDVMKFIGEVTGADVEVFWTDDKNSIGLDKDTPVTLNFEKGTALDLLEKVLAKATTDSTGKGNTWQLSRSGSLQVGPKDRLNSFRYVKVYSIADLLFETPNYENAPDFDLQSVLQNQGGNGGQSPFKDSGRTKVDKTPLPDRVKELQNILMGLVEPDQWIENGGNAASIHYFQGNFLVNAPDYIHRQVDGYPYSSRASGPTIPSGRLATAADSPANEKHDTELAQRNTPSERPATGSQLALSSPG